MDDKTMQENQKAKKLSEKAFLQGIIACVIGTLLCIACLSSATWAWFSESTDINNATIQPSDYNLTIEMLDSNGNLLDNDKNSHGRYEYTLFGGETYTVTLKALGTYGNGYGIMFVEGISGNWYTNLITIGNTEENPNPCVITLEPQDDVTVSFDLRWGKSGGIFDIKNGDFISISSEEVVVSPVSTIITESESSSEEVSESEESSSIESGEAAETTENAENTDSLENAETSEAFESERFEESTENAENGEE